MVTRLPVVTFKVSLLGYGITVELRRYIALKNGVSTAVVAVREKLFKLSLRPQPHSRIMIGQETHNEWSRSEALRMGLKKIGVARPGKKAKDHANHS